MTPDEQIAAIRERHAKATPGPLYVVQLDRECGEYSDQYYTLAIGPYEDDAADCFAFSHETCDRSDDAAGIEANFELFAHAHADIAHLLSRIDALTAERNVAVMRARAQAEAARESYSRFTAELAAANARADAIERDSDILNGAEWRRSVEAVNGDPKAAREHRIAALVAELEEANARADGERARVADELEERAIKLRHSGWTDKANELVYVAGLIRGEHEKGGG